MNNQISSFWQRLQCTLFPEFEETITPATEKHKEIALILDMVKVEDFIIDRFGPVGPGRPKSDRGAIVRAFIAKAILNLPTTSMLVERLRFDNVLRRLCGWIYVWEIPCEATFSNSFFEFSISKQFNEAHDSLIKRYLADTLIFHISRDSSAIEARETKVEVEEKEVVIKYSRGRPKRDEVRPEKEIKRLDKQSTQTLAEMQMDLPAVCNSGAKTNSKGHPMYWNGFKLHLDVADGGIPISAILTSASIHDSQVAIPLEEMTSQKVTSLYSLMDAAYDAKTIEEFIASKGKKAIADVKKKRGEIEAIPLEPCDRIRFKNRTTVERTFSDLKDNHGGRTVRVRGGEKVMAHLMAGVLVVTAKMLLRL